MATALADQLSALHLSSESGPQAGSSTESLQQRIRTLSREVSRLLDALYEVQELRHGAADTDRLNGLVASVDAAVALLPGQLEDVQTEVNEDSPERIRDGLQSVHVSLEELSKQYADVKREIKEDAWLARFASTASQAESMLAPLESSLMECLRYIEMIVSSPVPVSFRSDLPELPSYDKLQTLVQKHQQMKQAYMPSLSKILRMMEKSLNERATRNGVMVRRFDDIDQRWSRLQRDLQQLDSRLRAVHSQQAAAGDDVEMLASPPTAPQDYNTPARPPASHRSSISSGTSRSSPKPSPALGLTPAPQPLRRRTSFMSATSSSTARTVERVERAPPSTTMQTPANRRVASMNRSDSPASAGSSASRSRIPVSASPVPRLSLSTSRSASETHPVLVTPTRPRASGASSYMTVPRASNAPPFARSSTAPRPRGPPSSFRSVTPSPGVRPSSRLSMVSYAPSAVAPVNLQPFQPSKYDLLDTHVQSVIDQVGFKLFVARVDQPLRQGQRKRDDEEWKGDYVFGAGQRTSGVKLLKLAGRASQDAPRMKCMVRVQGAWHDLAGVLRDRQAKSGVE